MSPCWLFMCEWLWTIGLNFPDCNCSSVYAIFNKLFRWCPEEEEEPYWFLESIGQRASSLNIEFSFPDNLTLIMYYYMYRTSLLATQLQLGLCITDTFLIFTGVVSKRQWIKLGVWPSGPHQEGSPPTLSPAVRSGGTPASSKINDDTGHESVGQVQGEKFVRNPVWG